MIEILKILYRTISTSNHITKLKNYTHKHIAIQKIYSINNNIRQSLKNEVNNPHQYITFKPKPENQWLLYKFLIKIPLLKNIVAQTLFLLCFLVIDFFIYFYILIHIVILHDNYAPTLFYYSDFIAYLYLFLALISLFFNIIHRTIFKHFFAHKYSNLLKFIQSTKN